MGNVHVTRQQIGSSNLPDFAQEHLSEKLELRDGVGQLEVLSKYQDEVRMAPPMAADLVRLMNAESNEPWQQITALYWSVSPSAIRGAVDQVRTALTQLVAELRATMDSSDTIPSAEAADQAVNFMVTGKRARVNVNYAQAGESGTATASQAVESSSATATGNIAEAPSESGFWTRGRRIGAVIVGVATIASATVALIEFL